MALGPVEKGFRLLLAAWELGGNAAAPTTIFDILRRPTSAQVAAVGESCRKMGGWSTCRPEGDWEGLHIWEPTVCNKGVTGRTMTEAKRSSAGDQWCNGNALYFYYTSDFCCDGSSLPNK